MYPFIVYNYRDKNIVIEVFTMEHKIPDVVDELYSYFVPPPNPEFWPEYMADDPVRGHGLWSFYQGLQLGLRLAEACRD